MDTLLTDEERKRLGPHMHVVVKNNRDCTKEAIKLMFKERGMTYAALERHTGLAPGSINQSLFRRFPKADRVIARFFNIPVCELWPNRYLRNGRPIHHSYRVEMMSDEQLEKLNRATCETPNNIIWESFSDKKGKWIRNPIERSCAPPRLTQTYFVALPPGIMPCVPTYPSESDYDE